MSSKIMGYTQHVVPYGDRWAVKREGSRSLSVFKTKREAIDAGRSIASNEGVELIIHGPSGQIFHGPRVLSETDEEGLRKAIRSVSITHGHSKKMSTKKYIVKSRGKKKLIKK